jgi:hypothetical protein
MRFLQWLAATLRVRSSRPAGATAGRVADIHMWTIRDGWTSRAQAFRDEAGRTFTVITCRDGDRGPGHINGAEVFRAEAWAQFFPDEQVPPVVIANVLDPNRRFPDSPEIVTLDFDEVGTFDYHHATDPADIQTLERLGAEWDEGDGFRPYVPAPPTCAHVWRRYPVKDLPERHLFRDMRPFMTVDWGDAVSVAVQAIQNGGRLPHEVSPQVVAAARTLLYEPIELVRDGDDVRYINGQHRCEAMQRQGVTETVLRETRPIVEPPLPGEIGEAGIS